MSVALQVDEEATIALAELFRTLGEGARILILVALMGRDYNVTDLAVQAKLSESATSHHLRHLRQLRQLRLVKSRKEGRYVFYSLGDAHVEQLVRCGLEHVRHG